MSGVIVIWVAGSAHTVLANLLSAGGARGPGRRSRRCRWECARGWGGRCRPGTRPRTQTRSPGARTERGSAGQSLLWSAAPPAAPPPPLHCAARVILIRIDTEQSVMRAKITYSAKSSWCSSRISWSLTTTSSSTNAIFHLRSSLSFLDQRFHKCSNNSCLVRTSRTFREDKRRKERDLKNKCIPHILKVSIFVIPNW